jgi:hypothetical protein
MILHDPVGMTMEIAKSDSVAAAKNMQSSPALLIQFNPT